MERIRPSRRIHSWFVGCLVALAYVLATAPSHAWWWDSPPSDYTKTRYPIVLVPGVLAFNKLFGSYEYFNGIPSALREGGGNVYVVELAAFNSIEERGESLLQQLRYISAVSGSSKLNVVTHSQGGLDARYVMAVRPDLFASLTTIGAPHTGAALVDFLRENTTDSGFTRTVGTFLADSAGTLLAFVSGNSSPQNSRGTLDALSTDGMRRFNALYPAGLPSASCGQGAGDWRGIALYSWGGTATFTNPLDPTDYMFSLASLLAGRESDGLVDRCSSHFGKVIRDDYGLNHADEINQVLGLVNPFGTNPVSLFRAHANRLKNAGL